MPAFVSEPLIGPRLVFIAKFALKRTVAHRAVNEMMFEHRVFSTSRLLFRFSEEETCADAADLTNCQQTIPPRPSIELKSLLGTAFAAKPLGSRSDLGWTDRMVPWRQIKDGDAPVWWWNRTDG